MSSYYTYLLLLDREDCRYSVAYHNVVTNNYYYCYRIYTGYLEN